MASFDGDRNASTVNYYSNIVPQVDALNQGPWQDLEQTERNIVCSGQTLWVMTSPIYETRVAPLPNADETHTVPSHFWKILAGYDAHGLWVASFIFAQTTPRNADIEDHLVSVDEIEQRSHLDFFREMDDADEAVTEAAVRTVAEWNAILPTRGCPAPVR